MSLPEAVADESSRPGLGAESGIWVVFILDVLERCFMGVGATGPVTIATVKPTGPLFFKGALPGRVPFFKASALPG